MRTRLSNRLKRRRRLLLESLENRRVLAAYFVNSVNDGPGTCIADQVAGNDECTLRTAVELANQSAEADTITIAPGTYTVTSINGPYRLGSGIGGGDVTFIGNQTAGNPVIIDGGGIEELFDLGISRFTYTFRSLTLQNSAGAIGSGDPIDLVLEDVIAQDNRRAIDVDGSVTISNSIFRRNTTTIDGGAIRFINETGDPEVLSITDTLFEENSAGTPADDLRVGGAIFVQADDSPTSLNLNNVTFNQNTAGSSGGAVYSVGASVTIEGSTFDQNTGTGPDGGGGAVYLIDNATTTPSFSINNSTFTNNTSLAGGGALESVGNNGTITDSTFRFNGVTGNVPGFDTGGGAFVILPSDIQTVRPINNITITRTTVDQNVSPTAGGIAIVDVNVTITDSVISANRAVDTLGFGAAGGIGAAAGADFVVNIVNSRIVDNTSVSDAGGIGGAGMDISIVGSTIEGNQAGPGNGATPSRAGGVGMVDSLNGIPFARTPTLSIESSTIHNNRSQDEGGGIATINAAFSLLNTTISGNESIAGTGGGIAYTGQGIPQPAILFSTVADNMASASFSNISAMGTSIDVQGSIFSGGPALLAGGFTFNSLGDNIDSGTSMGFSQPSDLNNTDPLLGPLQDNGGPVHTRALLPGSPAIDSSSVVLDPLGRPTFTDARGIVRPVDGNGDLIAQTDRGAFEADRVSALQVSDVSVNESDGTASITVTLLGAVPSGFTATFTTGGATATATAGSDYTTQTGPLTFAGTDGETRTITIPIIDDTTTENDEFFEVSLSSTDTRVNTSDIGVVTILANDAVTSTLTLGGELFLDTGAGSLYENGIFDSSEVLFVDPVTVQLFLAGQTPGTDAPIATTTTVNGSYRFAGLSGGDYNVLVPASNFVSGGPLFSFVATNFLSPDPNNNVDNDDNGSTLFDSGFAFLGIVSGDITLSLGNEPTNDADTDPNTNTTLDFGVISLPRPVDLAITQTLPMGGTVRPGDAVATSITVTNLGPGDAQNVVVSDAIPAGLTFVSLGAGGASVTPVVNGNLVTFQLGQLGAGASLTFGVNLAVNSNASGTIFNVATVSSQSTDRVPTNNSDSVSISVTSNALLSGHVFCDANSSGTEDAGESIVGARVFLDGNDNRRFDSGETETTTDSQGNYAFTSVQSGAFVVVAEIPDTCSVIPSNPGVVRTLIDVGIVATSIAAFDRDFDQDLDLVVTSDLDGSLTTILNQQADLVQGSTEVLGSRLQKIATQNESSFVDPLMAVVGVGTGVGSDQGNLYFGNDSLTAVNVAGGPIDVLIDHFTDDSSLQIITASFRSSTLQMISTDGSFQPREITTSASQLLSIASGDVDGDFNVDLIATGYGFGSADSEISILLGDGQGNFSPLAPTGSLPRGKFVAVEVVDLDFDGVSEILAISRDSGTSSTLSVLGVVDGVLSTLSQTSIATKVTGVDVGFLDGDFIPDVAVISESENQVLFYRGIASGGYELIQTVNDVPSPSSLVIVDLENDGRSEVAVTNRYRHTISPTDTSPLLPSTVTVLRLQVAQEGVLIEQTPQIADFSFLSAAIETRMDVNSDQSVTPGDALQVFNALSQNRAAQRSETSAQGESVAQGESFARGWEATDVNLDGETTPLDALLILNQLAHQALVGRDREIATWTIADDDDETIRANAVDEVIAHGLF